jgi:AcrR family transcriptional regulator
MSESVGPEAGGRVAGDDGPRERILGTAYDLFAHHGVNAIGIDRIVAEAGVAKMTLYRHFRSKDDLAVAALERRTELWTRDWLQRELERRGGTAQSRLLAIFELFDDWFHLEAYSGCMFANCLLEGHDRAGAIGSACVGGLAAIRSVLEALAEEAGVGDPAAFAQRWHVLMLGAIVVASTGDVDVARGTRDTAALLLASEKGDPEAK